MSQLSTALVQDGINCLDGFVVTGVKGYTPWTPDSQHCTTLLQQLGGALLDGLTPKPLTLRLIIYSYYYCYCSCYCYHGYHYHYCCYYFYCYYHYLHLRLKWNGM